MIFRHFQSHERGLIERVTSKIRPRSTAIVGKSKHHRLLWSLHRDATNCLKTYELPFGPTTFVLQVFPRRMAYKEKKEIFHVRIEW